MKWFLRWLPLPGSYRSLLPCQRKNSKTVKVLDILTLQLAILPPFNLPIIPIVIIQQTCLTTHICIKSFTVKRFQGSGINSYRQLLKNKWYYVLYSTVKFISLCCKGKRAVRKQVYSGRSINLTKLNFKTLKP
jgi:hypothetical protein